MSNNHPKIIAVDFDGCLVTNKFPIIGDPIRPTIDALKHEQQNGAKIILWTCRRDEQVEAAARWCAENGIKLDAVNENLPEMLAFFGEDTRKVFADEYWDDRAVRMPESKETP
jgi:hydroxymethylpyrimidine pyrophosphatase-like HAD family hydrolase